MNYRTVSSSTCLALWPQLFISHLSLWQNLHRYSSFLNIKGRLYFSFTLIARLETNEQFSVKECEWEGYTPLVITNISHVIFFCPWKRKILKWPTHPTTKVCMPESPFGGEACRSATWPASDSSKNKFLLCYIAETLCSCSSPEHLRFLMLTHKLLSQELLTLFLDHIKFLPDIGVYTHSNYQECSFICSSSDLFLLTFQLAA